MLFNHLLDYEFDNNNLKVSIIEAYDLTAMDMGGTSGLGLLTLTRTIGLLPHVPVAQKIADQR